MTDIPEPLVWQPIETAPKNGTCLLLYVPGLEYEPDEYPDDWDGGYIQWLERPMLVGRWDRAHSEWRLAHYVFSYEPTHWMELPPSPNSSEGA